MWKIWKGIIFAINGIGYAIRKERNLKIHLTTFALVVILGLYFDLNKVEWLAILLVSALVISLELINSAIERLCDLYSREKDERIKNIKDISAGAVLLAAVFAVIIGVLVFWSHLFQ